MARHYGHTNLIAWRRPAVSNLSKVVLEINLSLYNGTKFKRCKYEYVGKGWTIIVIIIFDKSSHVNFGISFHLVMERASIKA